MTIFDFVVLIIFVVSILLSVVRGIVRESLSLAGWVIAFMVAKAFAKDFVSVLPLSITGDSLRVLVSFSALFLSVLLVMSMITMLASALIRTVGLGSVDRFFWCIIWLCTRTAGSIATCVVSGPDHTPARTILAKGFV